jgi:rhodanese-related sulfurtransferase
MRHLSTDGFVSFLRHHPQAKVLDVRFAYERESNGHLQGDHHVPWYTPDWAPDPAFLGLVQQRLSPDEYVLVICRCGHRSYEAAELLENSGFQHVYNVLGGYKELRENDATNNVADRSGVSLHYQEGMQNGQV